MTEVRGTRKEPARAAIPSPRLRRQPVGMSDVPRSHDRFFRRVFSQREPARELLREYLPAEVAQLLDLDSLEITDSSYIEDDLRGHVADLVLRVRLQDGRRAVVYVLVEHKSVPDRWVALQLLRYMIRIWDDYRRQARSLPLPPIIPLVFHQGRRGWNLPTDFAALVDAPRELAPHVPDFGYLLIDLTRFSDPDVRGPPTVTVPLLLMLHIFDDDLEARLVAVLMPVAGIMDAGARMELFVTCVYYVENARDDVSEAALARAVKQVLSEDEGERVMQSVADRHREEGRQQGIQQGLQQGTAVAREAVLEVLESRFGSVPEPLRERIGRIEDLDALRRLPRAAAICESLAAFRDALEGNG